MFKRKKKKTGIETPTYSRFSMAPEPKSTSKPNPNYVPPASVKKSCPYETPCGWCTKWDKKCDKKIGCSENKPKRGLRVKVNPIDDACDVQDYIKQKLGEPREDKSYIYF